MAVIGYTLVSILLILIQTALLPQMSMRPPFDLLVVQVVFTALALPRLQGGVVVLVTGVLVDGLSGSPFGFYLTSYFWLFFTLRVAIQVLHVYSRILIYLAILAGIVLENLVALLVLSVSGAATPTMMWAVEQGGRQLLWGALLGPVVYVIMALGYRLGGALAREIVCRLEGGKGV
ncbi:rod shape-determining protein MreD [Desulfoluna butyratoxydans]|uniref:Rod shape-determining protein MreD n=1 Tax=Desulfoluna butyratoxydans TaxID=231438 RepID=A0A4U8YJA9_9BACT|nr:hypothetical protein [Desulfoluna butyratoxydans]VFQ43394.1 hypothetical protein MSL71_10220 [Desulfoluna butyratoxydans]